MLYKGEYSPNTTYTKLDVVYQDSTKASYVSLQDNNKGHDPKDNLSYWGVISKAKYQLDEQDIKDAITNIIATNNFNVGNLDVIADNPAISFHYGKSKDQTAILQEVSKGNIQTPNNLTVLGNLNANASSAKVLDHKVKINNQDIDTSNGKDNDLTADSTLNSLKAGSDLSNTNSYNNLNAIYGLSGKYTATPNDSTNWNAILYVNSIPDNKHVTLTLIDIGSSNNIYYRTMLNGTWNAWTKSVMPTDLSPYQLSANKIANATHADTATQLQTARTIGGVSFNGTANINLPGVNTKGNQDTSGNADTATRLQTARNIGGVSFKGDADINLPGVNRPGNQNTTGNAATASKLGVARTITIKENGGGWSGSGSFDGSGNITISAKRQWEDSGNINGPSGSGIHAYKYGNVAIVSIQRGSSGAEWKAWTQSVETPIPEGFRPQYEMMGQGALDDGTFIPIVVQPSGKLFLRGQTIPANTGLYYRCVYPLPVD